VVTAKGAKSGAKKTGSVVSAKKAVVKSPRPTAKKAAAPAKKPAAKKAPAKKAGSANAAFMKPMTPSAALAAIIGSDPMPRTEVTKRLWAYIKSNGLQDKMKKTMINADSKLKEIFKKAQVSMFEMTKLISSHLK
jgi:upstream activation factor subunit UAF30